MSFSGRPKNISKVYGQKYVLSTISIFRNYGRIDKEVIRTDREITKNEANTTKINMFNSIH